MTAVPAASQPMSVDRRYQANAGAFLYTAITVFVAIGAINSQNNLLFIALGVAVSAMVVSGLISGAALVAVSIRRDPIGATRVDEPISLRYTIENRRRLPAFGLVIAERFAGEKKPRNAGAVAMLPGRQALRATGAIAIPQRGVHRIEELQVASGFPFGLLKKLIAVESAAEIVVGPRRVTLRPGKLPRLRGAARVAQSEASASPGHEEFIGLRDYVPGDSARLVAWRPTARLESMVVRQLVATSPPSVTLSILPHDPAKPWLFERSVALAAAAADAAVKAGVAVGVQSGVPSLNISPTHDVSDGGLLLRSLAVMTPEHAATLSASRKPRAVTLSIGPGGDLDPARLDQLIEFGAEAPEFQAGVETGARTA
ncbi:MAG: DUF58 domain-containing protein [Planctomycetota bacterium]